MITGITLGFKWIRHIKKNGLLCSMEQILKMQIVLWKKDYCQGVEIDMLLINVDLRINKLEMVCILQTKSPL